jgi:hypothetical protein
MTKPAAMCSRDGPGRDVNSAAPFTRLSEPFFMAQQASHAHDQHVTPACERLGDKLWQRRLAGGLDSEVAALDHLVDGNDRWVVRKFRGQRFCPGAILIRERDEVRIELLLVERGSDGAADGSYAENPDLQHLRGLHASSSIRSIAPFALRAMSSDTRTRGVNVSSERMTLSSVMVFMNAQTALELTG